jgi:hypothetical protein
MSRAEKRLRRRRRKHKRGRDGYDEPAFDRGEREWKRLEYEIVDEPMDPDDAPSRAYLRETPVVRREEFFEKLSERPQDCIGYLEDLLGKYPGSAVLLNWLGVAYDAAGRRDKREETVRLNYRLNPKYLFARVGYAGLCFERGDIDGAAAAIDHQFDLQLLYPNRRQFHRTEFLFFNALAVRLLLAIGQRPTAIMLLRGMQQIDPGAKVVRQTWREVYSPLRRLRRWMESLAKTAEERGGGTRERTQCSERSGKTS